MDTTALDADQTYRRVIEARFVTKPDKVTPLRCTTCNAVLVMGQAAAAVTEGGDWHSYCADCAADMAAQLKGLFARTRELGAEVSPQAQAAVQAFLAIDPADARAQRVPFIAAKHLLMQDRAAAGAKVAEAERAERVEVLKLDPVFQGLALATTPGLLAEKDRSFAESLATQWEQRGTLSLVARNGGPGQMHYAEKLAEKARKADAKGNVVKDWSSFVSAGIDSAGLIDGYYAVDHVGNIAHQDTTFVRILTGDDGTRFMRQMVGGKGETPSGGREWCLRVIERIVAQGAVESMRRYGREIHRCGKCHRLLTDKPSRDAGLGPVCAQAF